MAPKKRLFKSFLRLVLPLLIILAAAAIGASMWLIHKAADTPKSAYLATPDKYGLINVRAAQVTDESWTNRDNTQSRGWLLRGSENAPAIILLHRYGTDRSWLLDLGVKISEATNFTVLMPDARGHGDTPHVRRTTFGGCEADDVAAAMDFLKSLKSNSGNQLIGKDFGVYGIELGALAGMTAATKNENIKALVLDSVPLSSDEMLTSVINKRFPFAGFATSKLAAYGTRIYYAGNGCYNHENLCESAKSLNNRQILLLAGNDAPDFQESTNKLQSCLPNSNRVEANPNLTVSGYSFKNAPIAQSEIYERQVIEFFKKTLSTEK